MIAPWKISKKISVKRQVKHYSVFSIANKMLAFCGRKTVKYLILGPCIEM
jgi:hypothetical protein